MTDGQTNGAEITRAAQLFAAYLNGLIKLIEAGGSVRRHRSLREAAQSLDVELRIPDNQGYSARLSDLISRLRSGDRASWHGLLQRADAGRHQIEYDRLLELSPFRGTTLLFVEHWRSGNISLSGPFVNELAKRLNKHRKHDDEFREEFLLALAPLTEIGTHQVSRRPRPSED